MIVLVAWREISKGVIRLRGSFSLLHALFRLRFRQRTETVFGLWTNKTFRILKVSMSFG